MEMSTDSVMTTQTDNDIDVKTDVLKLLDNPLLIGPWLNWIVVLYLPILVTVSLVLNGLALDVLRSEYLKDLISQPILKCLLSFHLLIPIVGPLYVWLAQSLHIFITTDQVYPCFILLATHNFLMIASSWTLFLWIMERALSLNKSKSLWKMWQTACGKMVALLMGASIVLSVAPLMLMKGPIKGENAGFTDPVCLPWWGQETKADWFCFITTMSMVAPSVAMMVAVFTLAVFWIRFSTVLQWGVRTMAYYQAMNVSLKSAMHTKFLQTVVLLGFLFVMTSGPLGMYKILSIVFGQKGNPVKTCFSTQMAQSSLSTTHSGNDSFPSLTTVTSLVTNASTAYPDHALTARERSKCTTLAEGECMLWLLYYSFSWMIVPVLVASEVLFRREWKGKLLDIRDSLLCFLGKGRTTHPMHLRLFTSAFSNSDISALRGEDIVTKLDPSKNIHLESFINESTDHRRVRIRSTPVDGVNLKNAKVDGTIDTSFSSNSVYEGSKM